jgi:predicted AlkP superfamily pyrophosphatase or phosphodiesterase
MLSGATPAVSGIIGNDWFDRESGRTVTSVSDERVTPLGAAAADPASPHRMLVTTLGDEMKLASQAAKGSREAPRVFGLSLKDRSAILAVGRGADGAYWFDTKSGAFVSSTYYGPSAPAWLDEFNNRHLADSHAGQWWKLLHGSGPGIMLPAEPGPPLYNALMGNPYGNELLLALSDLVLTREQLGQRGGTDLLAISFSSNDGVGHTFGPDSPEVRDMSIKTDAVIGKLLSRVDKLVGLQHTLVAFTTDHGVAPIPEALVERRMPGGRMPRPLLFDAIQSALERQYGAGKWMLGTAGSSPYLNYELMRNIDAVDVRRVAAAAARTVPHVARVYTRDQLLRGAVGSDRIDQRVLRGFNATRSGDLEIVLEPYWIRDTNRTTHGSPYNYDAHIPLVLMGPGIKPGAYSQRVALNDLAPTLATLLKVEIPGGSSGRILSEALQPEQAATRRTDQ